MGCCAGVERNIHSNKEIFIIPDNDKQSESYNIKITNEYFTNVLKTNKKKIKKEESIIELKNQNLHKNEIGKDKDKDITPKTDIESDGKKLKHNKKKLIKKGSQRVQQALLELKLFSLKELDNNKKYFNQN